eukprot:COSAG06_NODE_8532_length_2137_cov_2.604024_1_plen_325_part_10
MLCYVGSRARRAPAAAAAAAASGVLHLECTPLVVAHLLPARLGHALRKDKPFNPEFFDIRCPSMSCPEPVLAKAWRGRSMRNLRRKNGCRILSHRRAQLLHLRPLRRLELDELRYHHPGLLRRQAVPILRLDRAQHCKHTSAQASEQMFRSLEALLHTRCKERLAAARAPRDKSHSHHHHHMMSRQLLLLLLLLLLGNFNYSSTATYSVPPRYSAAGTRQQQRHPANTIKALLSNTRFLQLCPEPVLTNSMIDFQRQRKRLRKQQGRRAFSTPPPRHPPPPPSLLGRENPINRVGSKTKQSHVSKQTALRSIYIHIHMMCHQLLR